LLYAGGLLVTAEPFCNLAFHVINTFFSSDI